MTRYSWDHESALAEAKRHANRASLFREKPGAYQYLKRHKILDGVLPKISRKRWTYSAIKDLCFTHHIHSKQGLALICPSASRAAYKKHTIDGVRWIDALFPSHGS